MQHFKESIWHGYKIDLGFSLHLEITLAIFLIKKKPQFPSWVYKPGLLTLLGKANDWMLSDNH